MHALQNVQAGKNMFCTKPFNRMDPIILSLPWTCYNLKQHHHPLSFSKDRNKETYDKDNDYGFCCQAGCLDSKKESQITLWQEKLWPLLQDTVYGTSSTIHVQAGLKPICCYSNNTVKIVEESTIKMKKLVLSYSGHGSPPNYVNSANVFFDCPLQ